MTSSVPPRHPGVTVTCRTLGIASALLCAAAVPGCTAPERVTEPRPPIRTCYRNEYPFVDGPGRDVLSLNVTVDGGRATGDYAWRPAFKDRREGRFEGSLDDGSIEATYAFVQEGRADTSPITIRLEPERAVVAGGRAELGLAATIERVDCPSAGG